MSDYEHSHDPEGRRPLRLRPLPRPGKPVTEGTVPPQLDDAEADDVEASERGEAGDEGRSADSESTDDGDGGPVADNASSSAGDDEAGTDDAHGGWIHEWEQPEG